MESDKAESCHPIYFLYMDELSSTLSSINTGCMVGDQLTNHLMYADDLVVFCPSFAGLEDLLKACDLYGKHHAILFNHKKCAVMIFRSRGYKNVHFENFSIAGNNIKTIESYKYLGHIMF